MSTREPIGRELLVGALGGVAIGVGGAPTEAQGPAFVGVMLVYAALRGLTLRLDLSLRREPASLRQVILFGFVVGFAANATTCAWVSDLLADYAFMPWPIAWLVASLMFLAQSLPFALAALLTRLLAPRPLALPLAWPLAWLASASALPMIFPWRLGNSQMGLLPFVQLAELGGLPLVDLALTLITALAVERLVNASPRARRASGWSALFLFALITGWGTWRLRELEEARASWPLLRVGIVQHNLDIPERMQQERWPAQMETTWALTREMERAHVDLVTWPESAFPWFVDRHALTHLPSDLALLDAGVQGPILFGAPSWSSPSERYNSVLLVSSAHFLGIVDKTRLMPFGERIPLWQWLPMLHPFLGPGLTAGPPEGGTLEIPLARDGVAVVGVLNCYEDLMDDHVQHVARRLPDFLSNHTNDAWFGPTRAPVLHHFLARMRAIETRRDLVRTVNTGVSGHISATGESLMTTQPFTRVTRIAEVRLSRASTLWVWLGDWVTPLSMVWLVGALWIRLRSAGRR